MYRARKCIGRFERSQLGPTSLSASVFKVKITATRRVFVGWKPIKRTAEVSAAAVPSVCEKTARSIRWGPDHE